MNPDFKIDLTQSFPHLERAPIVEAVIEIRTRAQSHWEESAVTQLLKAALPEYPNVQSMNAVQGAIVFGPEMKPHGTMHELGWNGLRLQSADQMHVVQFNRDSFIFSRLRPYQTWERLEEEATRLWKLHVQIANPGEILRLGVRFINRIQMPPQETQFEDYIDPHPRPPHDLDLPFLNFLYRETLIVPGHNYGINLTRTLQPSQNPILEGAGIILDIDVFTMQPFPPDPANLDRQLIEMRWLKNKSFFGTITSKALEALR